MLKGQQLGIQGLVRLVRHVTFRDLIGKPNYLQLRFMESNRPRGYKFRN
jgi:hypothetical protein